jgi:CxxC motif-containing protein (DUF1111 family)
MRRVRRFVALSIMSVGLAACGQGDLFIPHPTAEIQAVGDTPMATKHLSQADIEAGVVPLDGLLQHGRLLFAAAYNTLDGAGRPETRGTGTPRGRREAPQNFNRFSAPDANACGGCHNLPRLGGGGENAANVFVMGQRLGFLNFDGGEGDDFETHTLDTVANERTTIGMFGAGFIELLAREITTDLHATRDAAIAQAAASSMPVTLPLSSKGLSFGSITAQPDGTLDTGAVEGVDADLVVKPVHQKGVVISLREFTNNAMNHHHGMQTSERFGAGTDADADGVVDELSPGDVTAVTVFQATLPAPGRVYPGSGAMALQTVARGEQLFTTVGCASCHVPELVLDDPVFTEPGPFNPPGNLGVDDVATPLAVDLTTQGPGPHLPRRADGSVVIRAFTDFKRHDMGPDLAEPLAQAGVPGNMFLTKKLWGSANESPFMHHGRATTLTEAILMHGGEAAAARSAFAALPSGDQAAVIAFLKTLQVLPEDAPSNEITGTWSGIMGDEPALAFGHVSQTDVDAGHFSPEALAAIGEQIFGAHFNTLDGAGRPESTGTGAPRARREAPQNFNRISGPDTNSCAGCHNAPRIGGGGENVANVFVLGQARPFVNFDGTEGDDFLDLDLGSVANERASIGMFGSGYMELLAREMSSELRAIRDQAIAQAGTGGASVTLPLSSKGVSFGSITAQPDGSLDTGAVEGVDADLVVKPFHQKGVVVSLREFTNNAMNHHHGMQTSERFGAGADPDADGFTDELTEGDVTAVTLFQAMLPVPGVVLPTQPARLAAVERGEQRFADIGCATCHWPTLVLDDPVFTEPNPFNPPGNLQPGGVPQPFAVDLTIHGVQPRLARRADGKVEVPAFTDLKRHDMGPDLAEVLVQAGVPGNMFLTKKLWGAANEPPFMHHGRATTLDEAIRMHGGEAQAARDAYVGLSEMDRDCIVDFLKSLEVLPAGSARVVTR